MVPMKPFPLLVALFTSVCVFSAGCSEKNIASTRFEASSSKNTVANSQTQNAIQIIGASTPYPALKLLADAYITEHTHTTVTFLDSSQSSGGITGVKEGLVDLGTVTRSPKPEEADSSLFYRELAKDALLVATHPSVSGITALTTEQLRAIYSGEATNWQTFGGPNAEIVVLDRAEDTSAKRLLREYYLGADLPNAKDAIVLRRESDISNSLQSTPYSIGIISRARAVTEAIAINPLDLDGVAPTPRNIQTGDYAMHRTLGVVWYKTPLEKTQPFLDFVFSPSGADILAQAGFAPLVSAD